METNVDLITPSRLLTPIDMDQLSENDQKKLRKGQVPILMISCKDLDEQEKIFNLLDQANYELLSEDPDYPHKKELLGGKTSFLNVVMFFDPESTLNNNVLIIVSRKDLGNEKENIDAAILELINKANSSDPSLRLEKL